MEKVKLQEESTKSSRMVGYLAAAVALLAVAFIVMIACSTYLIENKECEESVTNAVAAPMADAENCESFHYDGQFGNTTYSEHTTVCESTKTEFGIVRDRDTGFIINTFFADYIEGVEMVYLARSHKCLLTNDMGKDDFYDDLESFRNENYDRGAYAYSVGDRVNSWEAIPENMRGYCSPQNTYEWLKQEPDLSDYSDGDRNERKTTKTATSATSSYMFCLFRSKNDYSDGDDRNKRQTTQISCCFFVYGGYKYFTWYCYAGNSGSNIGSHCAAWVYGTWSCPPQNALQECVDAFCIAVPNTCQALINWIAGK